MTTNPDNILFLVTVAMGTLVFAAGVLGTIYSLEKDNKKHKKSHNPKLKKA